MARLKKKPAYFVVAVLIAELMSILHSCIWNDHSASHPFPYIAPPLLSLSPDLTDGDKNIYSTPPRDLWKWDQALYTQQLVSDSLLALSSSPIVLKNRDKIITDWVFG